jgi:hypothetical protein
MKILYFIIIICLYLFYIYYNKNEIKKIDYVINPSYYELTNKTCKYNKFLSTKILLNSINVNKNILDIYKNIHKKINKHTIYGIKKKDNKYRLELYLYRKNINNDELDDNNKFIDQILILLLIIDKNINIIKIKENLNKLFTTYDINIVSFDINLTGKLFNDIMHIYVYDNTYEYYLINNIVKLESKYCTFNNYNELYTFLFNYNKSESFIHPTGYIKPIINCNINNIINELKEIAPECKKIIFHHKYYNNNFGVYLINNKFKYLEAFLKKYNYKEITNKKEFKELNFDLVINYDYNGYSNSNGFSDFF